MSTDSDRLLVANLGDSRAVLGRQKATCFASLHVATSFLVARDRQAGSLGAVRLSDDHKPGRPDEQRRIEGNGGVVDMQAPDVASCGDRYAHYVSSVWRPGRLACLHARPSNLRWAKSALGSCGISGLWRLADEGEFAAALLAIRLLICWHLRRSHRDMDA